MPKIAYKTISFSDARRRLIDQANAIIDEYAAQGFDLTLRQLYYQFVARGLIRNLQREYKRLGDVVNDARLAGLIDWTHITDRTRSLRSLSHWTSPAEILESAAGSFRLDRWAAQPWRPEVWIEKDALVGVIEAACRRFDVPYFSCRGYTSQSEMWGAAQRLLGYIHAGQTPIVLHLGDHDPSGIDMTRDIADRLAMFCRQAVRVDRLALNRAQVDQYNPPPNPAKTADSRYAAYIALHGTESWELDALDPTVLSALIEGAIDELIELKLWARDERAEKRHRADLLSTSRRWKDVRALVGRNGRGGAHAG